MINDKELLIWTDFDNQQPQKQQIKSFEETILAQHKTIFEVENELYLAQKRIDELVELLQSCDKKSEPEIDSKESKRDKLVENIKYYTSLHYTKYNNYDSNEIFHIPKLKYSLSLYPLSQKYDLNLQYQSPHQHFDAIQCISEIIRIEPRGRLLTLSTLLLPNYHESEIEYEIELLSYVLEKYKTEYLCIDTVIELEKLLNINISTT